MRLSAVAAAAAVALGAVLLPGLAAAHAGHGNGLDRLAIGLSQALFGFVWLCYVLGAARLRPTPARRLCLHAAMVGAGIALFGPFDDWAQTSTAMHMAQHMLLIAVAAPLAALARPLPQWRAFVGPAFDPLWRGALRLTRRPMTCAALHAAALWVWHAPAPYMAAVLHTGWHLAEHAAFLLSAGLFWWSVLHGGRRRAFAAAAALLFTLMHTGLLGALLTFAAAPLYWRESRELWDQQLAGLIMWVPGSIAYLAAAAWLAGRLLVPGDRAGTRADCAAGPIGADPAAVRYRAGAGDR